MRLSAKTLVLAASLFHTTPATSDTLTCLQSAIDVTSVEFDKSIIENREIKVSLTNNMNIPLGGVWIDFEIWAAERPTAIYRASIREAATIDGGLLPGETMIASDFHFMDERSKGFAVETEDLTIKLTVLNAADILMRGFFQQPATGSWTESTTDETCS